MLFDFADEPVLDRRATPRRRVLLVAAVAAVLIVAGGFAVRQLVRDDGAGADDASPSSATDPGVGPGATGSGGTRATTTTIGMLELLPECPTPEGAGWTDLGLTGLTEAGREQLRHTFVLDAAATRPGGAADHELVLSMTVSVAATSPNNPRLYWNQHELAIGADRLVPVCFSTLDARDIPAGGSTRVYVGFEPLTAPGTPGILLVNAGEGSGRIDLAAT
jgi:hypothetical protein